MKKTAAEAAATRQAILQAALEVFGRYGYTATTLEQIGRAAGFTRGAVYGHFQHKAQLYHELVQSYADRSLPLIQQAASEGGTFIDICRRILMRLLSSLEDDPQMRAVMELTLFKTEHHAELDQVTQEQLRGTRNLIEMLAGIMQQGIAIGALRADCDPYDVARAFLAYQQGLFHLWLTDPTSFSLRERAPHLTELFLTGISA